MIDLSKLDEPEILPEDNQNRDSARNDEPPRVLGPVDHYGFPIKYSYRRAFSNQELLQVLEREPLTQGFCHFFLTRGNVDLISFLEMIARVNSIRELGIATFSANPNDIRRIRLIAEAQRIQHTSIYLGTVFHHSAQEDRSIDVIYDILGGSDIFDVKIIKNHAKVIFGIGSRFPFVVTSSANLNTNFNIEATVVMMDRFTYDFCKEFFDKTEEVEL